MGDSQRIEAIQGAVQRFPTWGVRKIWALIRREGVWASRDRVWKTVQTLGLTLPPMGQRDEPRRRGHVAVPESNRRWATDLTTTWTERECS